METKLHLGSGTRAIDGFINLDNSPAILLDHFKILKILIFRLGLISKEKYEMDWSKIRWCDISKGIPYPNKSISKIYTSHFIEHLSKKDGLFVLKECYRVLKENGIMRLVIPNLLFHAKKYVEKTEELLLNDPESSNTTFHEEFLKTVAGAFIIKKRKGLEHSYMYDIPSIRAALKTAGFNKITISKFKVGLDEELSSLDSRPDESIFLDIIK